MDMELFSKFNDFVNVINNLAVYKMKLTLKYCILILLSLTHYKLVNEILFEPIQAYVCTLQWQICHGVGKVITGLIES